MVGIRSDVGVVRSLNELGIPGYAVHERLDDILAKVYAKDM